MSQMQIIQTIFDLSPTLDSNESNQDLLVLQKILSEQNPINYLISLLNSTTQVSEKSINVENIIFEYCSAVFDIDMIDDIPNQISFLDKYCNYLQPNNDNTIMINKLICNKIKTDINLDLIKLILQTKYIKHMIHPVFNNSDTIKYILNHFTKGNPSFTIGNPSFTKGNSSSTDDSNFVSDFINYCSQYSIIDIIKKELIEFQNHSRINILNILLQSEIFRDSLFNIDDKLISGLTCESNIDSKIFYAYIDDDINRIMLNLMDEKLLNKFIMYTHHIFLKNINITHYRGDAYQLPNNCSSFSFLIYLLKMVLFAYEKYFSLKNIIYDVSENYILKEDYTLLTKITITCILGLKILFEPLMNRYVYLHKYKSREVEYNEHTFLCNIVFEQMPINKILSFISEYCYQNIFLSNDALNVINSVIINSIITYPKITISENITEYLLHVISNGYKVDKECKQIFDSDIQVNIKFKLNEQKINVVIEYDHLKLRHERLLNLYNMAHKHEKFNTFKTILAIHSIRGLQNININLQFASFVDFTNKVFNNSFIDSNNSLIMLFFLKELLTIIYNLSLNQTFNQNQQHFSEDKDIILFFYDLTSKISKYYDEIKMISDYYKRYSNLYYEILPNNKDVKIYFDILIISIQIIQQLIKSKLININTLELHLLLPLCSTIPPLITLATSDNPLYSLFTLGNEFKFLLVELFELINLFDSSPVFIDNIAESLKENIDYIKTMNFDNGLIEKISKIVMSKTKITLDESIINDLPEEFIDQISGDVITNPVMLPKVNDLFFNKSSIMAHLLVNKTNPYTNEYLDEKLLEQYNSDIENVKKNKDIIRRYNDYIASKNM